MQAKAESTKRTIQKEIEITVPLEAVWKALTDPDTLTRWFPLQARVTPGTGGLVWFSWGPNYEGEARIQVWEPNRRLRLLEPAPGTPRADVTQIEVHPSASGALRLQEWTLETREGKTIVRLVNPGFTAAQIGRMSGSIQLATVGNSCSPTCDTISSAMPANLASWPGLGRR